MKKEPLKVGDRVRVYGHVPSAGKCYLYGDSARIIDYAYMCESEIKVVMISESLSRCEFVIHPKQCRRLISRKKVWPQYGFKDNVQATFFLNIQDLNRLSKSQKKLLGVSK